jgi:hypothetical protein
MNKVVIAKELAINFYNQGIKKKLILQDECLSLYGEYVENSLYFVQYHYINFSLLCTTIKTQYLDCP